ncbi:hypothetical protein D0T49_08345 [Paludibacter sp. 221]|uniref:FISUMP domain-containing protein n=1 Tax=Paludibacter sp. 221 TaxID=2302939 RepID=UPI0013D35753|nr:FISUMP domain-containing protein [Paludibacter sp. 221]NDV47054.1 hypothetical protein [Paludibacter sp. 221]
MKTKNNLFIFVLAVCVWLCLPLTIGAQVKIGEEMLPTKGAVLDLKKTTTGTDYYLGGLLLPNVEILNLGYIPATFTDAENMVGYDSTDGVDTNELLAGTIVYNTKVNNTKNIRAGVYIWDGKDWMLISDGASMRLESTPGVFDEDGGSEEITVANPGCTLSGNYTYIIVGGSEYASINPSGSSDGKFSVTFDANPTTLERKAVVLVTDPCGKTATFVFTQAFNPNICIGAITVPPINSYSGNQLCSDGAAYLYLVGSIEANDPNDYIWTLNDVEVGRGDTYTATKPGKYVVYYAAIGCENNSGEYELLPSDNTAPNPVRIIVNSNNGFVCEDRGETTIIAQTADAGMIRWFKDGVLQTGSDYDGKESISADIGVWHAVVYDGGNCWSKPSDAAIVQLDPNAGMAVPEPIISVNGVTSQSNYSFCAGGMAHLQVTNPSNEVTRYTWYAENTEIGYGTSVYYNIPTDVPNVIIRCRAQGQDCSTETIVLKQIEISSAPAAPRITGLNVLCGGGVTLTANASEVSNPEFIWYYGSLSDTEALTTLATNGQNLTVETVGIYQVAVKDGNCISKKSTVKTVELSDFVDLRWKQTHTDADYGMIQLFEVEATNGPVTYKWEVINAELRNTNENRTSVVFPTSGTSATVKVTATNACGSKTIEQEVTLSSTCADPIIPTPSVNQMQAGVVGHTLKMPIMVQGGVNPSFQWYMNGARINNEPTATTATYVWTPTATGTYVFYCVVINNCQNGTSNPVQSKAYIVNVIDNPDNYITGTGTFTGKTCFDIVYSNFATGGHCGTQVARASQKTDFSLTTEQDPAAGSTATYTAKQVYTFTTSGSVSNVRFTVVDEDGDIVESITPKGNYSGNLASGTACKVTVLYKESLNESLRGLTANNAKILKLYAIYTSSGTDYSVPLTIKLQDCACCGANIDSGWLTFMCHNLGADETLDPFTPAQKLHGNKYRFGVATPSYTMLLDQTNSSSISGWGANSTSAYPFQETGNWSETNNPCPEGWRLPTQSEWQQVINPANNAIRREGVWNENATNYTSGIYFGEGLFLPTTGYRYTINGRLYYRGINGLYWSSTQSGSNAYSLNIGSTSLSVGNSTHRAMGVAVRCVAK